MNYANYISKVGEQYFGRKFNAIRDFMPLEEYNKFLLSADVFIYGNWRQEAVGNILIALFIGGKVFLDEKNPLLKFYKDKGLVIIYSYPWCQYANNYRYYKSRYNIKPIQ